jgi:hypothetical protein
MTTMMMMMAWKKLRKKFSFFIQRAENWLLMGEASEKISNEK